MLLFHQRLGRNVLEHHAVLFQTLALFMWIQPVARSAQWETAFVHAGNKHRAKAQPADVGRLQHPDTVTIARGDRENLRFQTTLKLIDESSETDAGQKPD